MDPESEEVILDQESDGELESEIGDDFAEDSDETDFEEEQEMEIDDFLENNLCHDWNLEFEPNFGDFDEPDVTISEELNISRSTSPLELVRKFLSDEIVEDILTESSRFVEQVKASNQKAFQKWKPLCLGEFWRFIAVVISMGLVKKSAIKDYWTTDPFFSTPFFPQVISRDRFLDIMRSLHFVNNTEVPVGQKDRFVKLGQFLPNLLSNFKKAIKPGRELCIDESLLGYKGRLAFKQYNPKKRARFGIKFFMLADCDSKFILDILPYQGKSTQIADRRWIKDLGFGGAAVMTLLQDFLGKCHRVIADNWFMSPKLATQLLAMQTYILGTVQKKRKDMPKNLFGKLVKGAVTTFSNGLMLVERWMDRRDVCMLNTFIPHGMTESLSNNPNNNRLKPNSVLLYNKKMGALDDCDKIIKPYQSIRKSYKWYKKVAFHLLDITWYNSHLLYCIMRITSEKPNYKSFLESLIKDIIHTFPGTPIIKGRPSLGKDPSQRLVGMHLVKQNLKSNGNPSKSDCFYCKLKGLRRATQYSCKSCKKRLCITGEISCFEKYHTFNKLPKKKTRAEDQTQTSRSVTTTQSTTTSQSQSLLINLFESQNTANESQLSNSNGTVSSLSSTGSQFVPLSSLYTNDFRFSSA